MSMPKIPDLNPDINITREDAVNIIITSIAMEELAIAHILNAEGEKLQYVLGTLDNRDPGEVTICDIMAVNNSIQKTLRDVIKAEMLLQFKLEDAIELAENEDGCRLTIKGRIIWRDGNNVAATRPATVEISLLRDGKVIDTATVSSTGNGVYTFPCLPVWRDSENKYTYQVDELVVPAKYTKTIEGFNVINTVEPGSISIEGKKTWVGDGAGATRPTKITVNLLANSEIVDSMTVDSPAAGQATSDFKFDDMPQFDSNGNPYVYSVDEEPVAGYKKSIEGYHITNTFGTI